MSIIWSPDYSKVKDERWSIDFTLYSTLILVRGCRPGKIVQMTEGEVRGLCLKSREIFLSQPILLELEAPLKICGNFVGFSLVISTKKMNEISTSFPLSKVTFTVSTLICFVSSNMEDFHLNRIIYFLVTMSTEESNLWKQFVYYSLTK